jgi:predicted adenine nucleotide alpha hydrolase (AANH) superfamily ATPase
MIIVLQVQYMHTCTVTFYQNIFNIFQHIQQQFLYFFNPNLELPVHTVVQNIFKKHNTLKLFNLNLSNQPYWQLLVQVFGATIRLN